MISYFYIKCYIFFFNSYLFFTPKNEPFGCHPPSLEVISWWDVPCIPFFIDGNIFSIFFDFLHFLQNNTVPSLVYFVSSKHLCSPSLSYFLPSYKRFPSIASLRVPVYLYIRNFTYRSQFHLNSVATTLLLWSTRRGALQISQPYLIEKNPCHQDPPIIPPFPRVRTTSLSTQNTWMRPLMATNPVRGRYQA